MRQITRYFPSFLPILLIFGVQYVLWLVADTPHDDILKFIAHELIFVFAPGFVWFYTLVGSHHSMTCHSMTCNIAFGWALGYVIHIAVFYATSYFQLRPLFTWVLLIILAIGAFTYIFRRRIIANDNQIHLFSITKSHLALYLLICLSLVYLALGYFTETPLKFSSVTHHPDLIWQIGNAASALRQVPLTDPRMAGETLNYHNFVYYHMAAIHQQTNIELSTIVFRLYLVPMLIVIGLELFVLGRWVRGRSGDGLLTVILFFFLGEFGLQLSTPNPYAFLNTLFTILWLSPTYTLGLVFFIPLLIIGLELMYAGSSQYRARYFTTSILFLLLLIGAEGAKAASLPVLLGGAGFYLGIGFIAHRKIIWRGWAMFACIATVLALFFFGVYRNSEAISGFRPFAGIYAMPSFQPWLQWASNQPRFVRWPFLAMLVPLGAFLHMPLQWVGFFAVIRNWRELWQSFYSNSVLSQRLMWLSCISVVGMTAFLILSYSNLAQTYFILYAYPASCAIGAIGLREFYSAITKVSISLKTRVISTISSVLVVLLAIFSALDFTYDNFAKWSQWLNGQVTYSQENRALTAKLLEGMQWLRAHSQKNDIIAVNNQRLLQRFPGNGYYWYYSAFTERQIFFEGWVYTDRARRLGYTLIQDEQFHPFPDRLELNQRVFENADAQALITITRDYGVRFLLIDKIHASYTSQLTQYAMPVFENEDILILKMDDNKLLTAK